MEIIFQGQHNNEEAAESFLSVLRLFKEKYHIETFREIHFSVTLVDDCGEEVELVDTTTAQPYRVFEVYRQGHQLAGSRHNRPKLQLVIDNTQSNKKN